MLLEAGFETSVNTTPPDTTSHDNSAHKVLDSVYINLLLSCQHNHC